MEQDNNFSLGRSSEISRDEVKFAKFVDRLRNKFSQILYKALRVQLILKGVITEDDWDEMKYYIRFDFKRDNYYAEAKDTEILQNRVNMLQQVAPFIGQFYSTEYVQKQILRMTDEDIQQMQSQMATDQPPEQQQEPDGNSSPEGQQIYK